MAQENWSQPCTFRPGYHLTMTMTILSFSGRDTHRTCNYIQFLHIEYNRTIHRLHVGHFKRIKVNIKDKDKHGIKAMVITKKGIDY